MKIFQNIPLFLFVFLFYNLILLTAPHLVDQQVQVGTPAVAGEAAFDPAAPAADQAASGKPKVTVTVNPLFSVPLISGATWYPTLNELIILFSVLVLYFEVFKATRTSVSSIIEHVFSLFVFIAFLVEFLIYDKAGTSTFLVVTALSLIDVIGGFTITISTARRDFGVGGHGLTGGGE